MRSDRAVIGVFIKSPLERHRPGGTRGAHIGQRLLHAHGAFGSIDQKHEIEVAIAHFANLAIGRLTAEARTDIGQPAE